MLQCCSILEVVIGSCAPLCQYYFACMSPRTDYVYRRSSGRDEIASVVALPVMKLAVKYKNTGVQHKKDAAIIMLMFI